MPDQAIFLRLLSFIPSQANPTAISKLNTIRKINKVGNPEEPAIPSPSEGAEIVANPYAIEYSAEYCPCLSFNGLDKAKFIMNGMAKISEKVMMIVYRIANTIMLFPKSSNEKATGKQSTPATMKEKSRFDFSR